MRFRDRQEAGTLLGEAVAARGYTRPVVLGIARGGVPVAREVAKRLAAPFDVLVVRKIGAPWNPEYAIGAMADGVIHLDEATIARLGVPRSYLTTMIPRESEELKRRETVYREGRSKTPLEGCTAIIVDDGLATGASARVAIESVRRRKPSRIVLAVPVAAPETVADLKAVADEVIALGMPPDFRAVSAWYVDFSPTTDAEVLACLGFDRERSASAVP